jgi:hypothetical protein
MRLAFRRSGGYLGLTSTCEVDTATLPPDEAAQLQELVKQSGVDSATSAHSARGADLIEYELVLETPHGSRTVAFDTMTLPSSARPLVEYLESKCPPL